MTNVYAPTTCAGKAAFLAEVQLLRPMGQSWLLFGDFNMTRAPADKSTDSFSFAEASMFNDAINSLELIELPLRDRAFTWYNNHEDPTLVRLDRAFIKPALK